MSDPLVALLLSKLNVMAPPEQAAARTPAPTDPNDPNAALVALEAAQAAAKRQAEENAQQANLLAKAMKLANTVTRTVPMYEVEAGTSLRAALSARRAELYRKLHRLYLNDLMLTDSEAAFGDPPDGYREAFAAFCHAMLRGYGQRFLDRHESETPEDFVDRPRKTTINLTALCIGILSKLYHNPPVRKLDEATPEPVSKALTDLWSDPLYNLSLLEVDRLTRLLGTVAVRPFYDPSRPGKIRLWAFLNHQLRVITHPLRPWEPAAVIERVQPFRASGERVIWTDRYVAIYRGKASAKGEITLERHGLGRIPHVFFRDSLSYTSFFVEGRGRMLATPNAHINNRLTDLHEVEQMQGFATMEVYNPDTDDITPGPRRAIVFRPGAGDQRRFGVEFKNPGAPLRELRGSIEEDIRGVLRDNRIPEAALGAAIQQRQLSGAAIRAAMAPLFEDWAERGRLFETYEIDLADACLRIRAEHEPEFDYTPGIPLRLTVQWQAPSIPLDTAEQVKREEFDVAQGVQTPADLMYARWPQRFKTREQAVDAWKANLEETAAAGFAIQDTDTNPASMGEPGPEQAGLLAALQDSADALDAMGKPLGAVPGEPAPTPRPTTTPSTMPGLPGV